MVPDIDKTIYLRPVELLQELIRFNTSNPPGNERECVTYISHLLDSNGIKTHMFSKDPHRPNLVARLKGKSDGPALLLYGHVDVVPAEEDGWRHPPFDGVIDDGFVWGRGALDMKGPVAMMLSAFIKAKVNKIQLPGDVVLCILSDEEDLGEFGARFMVEKHPELFKGVRYALGEFGGFTLHAGGKRFYPIEIAQKQKCGLKAILRGPAGHASSVVRDGAMAKLSLMLDRLNKNLLPVHVTEPVKMMFNAMADVLPFPNGWLMRKMLNPRWTDFILRRLGERGSVFIPMFRNTVNATVLNSGERINVIPSKIEVDMDVRILPGFDPDDVVKELRPIIGGDVELELIVYDKTPAEPDLTLFNTLASILKDADPEGIPIPFMLTGCTDARFLSRLGIQTYGFVPMKLPEDLNLNRTTHAPNERIPTESLQFGADAILNAMQQF